MVQVDVYSAQVAMGLPLLEVATHALQTVLLVTRVAVYRALAAMVQLLDLDY